MSEWRYYAVCEICGWKKYAPFKSFFHANIQCCPECGNEDDFLMRKMRWNNSKIKFYNPLTWNRGFWETFTENTKET